MNSLNQIRAKNAFAETNRFRNNTDQKEYLSLAKNLPTMFQTNGLLATWAFLLSKNDKRHYQNALSAVVSHFKSGEIEILGNEATELDALRQWTARGFDSVKLMNITIEAVQYAGWLKRAAEALCDPNSGGGSNG